MKVKEFLDDPLLDRMYREIKEAGQIRSILLDITHECNLRCIGCYFFAEDMDKKKVPADESEFDAFIEREKERGTNFITVTGGEPTLKIDHLKKLHDNFTVTVVTNGINRIPLDGFENMSIAISVWGDHDTDKRLRGNGKIDVFSKGLKNYKDDSRVGWYYTTPSGYSGEISSVTEKCVGNGNYVVYNFYGDLTKSGLELDHRMGFDKVCYEINRMIKRYPDRIVNTSYMIDVITKGELYDEKWGYDVCTSFTFDHVENQERVKNGKPYNAHFRAYYPDLVSTRRCCVGEKRDCSNCFDVWAHFAWIMLNMKKHIGSKQEFTNWLTTVYIFYVMNRFVDFEEGMKLLPELHKRVSPEFTAKEIIS